MMNEKIRITKQFDFEMAHSLHNYDGACKNIHGHSYKLSVTLIGHPIKNKNDIKQGMVIDFSELKKIVKEHIIDVFDHAYVMNEVSSYKYIQNEVNFEKVYLLPYQPTCENMIIDFKNRIIDKLPKHVELFSLKLYETATSFAEWYASDNS